MNYTVSQFAKKVKLSNQRIYQLIREGEIKSHTEYELVLIAESEIEKVLKRDVKRGRPPNNS